MKISYILDSVDSGTVVLPEFQRGYVWTREQVKGLIQSLYHRYPVGGLLIWNTRGDTTNLRGESATSADTVKLLLDGQQRVTTLYGVLRGAPPPFFDNKEKASAFTGLHFHLGRETFEFFQKSRMAGDPLWISVTKLMLHGPAAVLATLAGIDPADQLVYMERLLTLHAIREIDLHDENISGDHMTVDVVVDIFNRVNSGGTKLSKGDLALARICALRPEARDELRTAVAKWSNAGFDFALDWFLRCVNVVVTGEARFEALHKISAEDFGVGVKKAERAVDFVLNLLATRLGLDHDRVLMGRYGIPALVRLVVDSGGSLTGAKAQNDALYWYIHQAAWGRYSGSTESVLDRDLEAIERDGVEGLIRELALFRGSLTVRPDDFDVQTVASRFYPILYMLTRVHDARDLGSGLPLSAHLLGRGSQLEVHHVFPKAQLYQHGYSKKQANEVANFAFLTGDSNRAIGMRAPAGYFAETAEAYPGALESQWITTDRRLWELENYAEFLADRRQRLADATNAFLDGLRSGSTDPIEVPPLITPVIEEPETVDDLQLVDRWCSELGLARPTVPGVVTGPDGGEALVYPDAVWLEGLQPGRSERVAVLLERDEESEARLGLLGFRFFTDVVDLRRYLEGLVGLDLDGDGVIGSPDRGPETSSGRTWYVNFGDGLGRSWDDARRHGFVSAGGGAWYSRRLHKLQPGDTVLAYLPGKGYAGIGTVTRIAVPFEQAVVDTDDGPRLLRELPLTGPYAHDVEDEDPGEYVVTVAWLTTLAPGDACRDADWFSNQVTVVEMLPTKPTHAATVAGVRSQLLGEELGSQALATKASSPSNSARANEHLGKYRPLWEWLRSLDQPEIECSFAEIEGVLGFQLPDSCRDHVAHWHSYDGSAVARAIIDAGWHVRGVRLSEERITFVPGPPNRRSPNAWDGALPAATSGPSEITPTNLLYQEFWTRFRTQAVARRWTNATAPAANWWNLPSGVTGATWGVSFARFGCRSELFFGHPNPDVNFARWQVLKDQESTLVLAFAGELILDDLPMAKGCRVEARRLGPTIAQRDLWDSVVEWFVATQERLRQAIDSVGGVPTVMTP